MSVPTSAVHQRGHAGYKERLRESAHAVLDPLVRALIRVGLQPNHFTIAGLLLSGAAAIAFYDGQSRVAAGFLIAGGVCDILDGQVARLARRVTRFGAFLDSTLDRLAESFVLLGLAGFYASNLLGLYTKSAVLVGQVARAEIPAPIALAILQREPIDPRTWVVLTLTSVLALIGSFMVSYTRARAEGLGLECKVGWFERPERIVLLIIAGLVQVFWVMSAALMLLTIFSFTTAAQRMAHVWKLTRAAAPDSETD